jgi:probable rRNA maturation factor
LYFYPVANKIPVFFFKENVQFRLNHSGDLKKWIENAARRHGYKVKALNYIFCSDNYLLKLNKQYLQHNYFTDIITFDNSTEKKSIEADVFISVETVKANAEKFRTSFRDELHRVMIHGALHLVGYKDKKEKDILKMKEAEEHWLTRRKFLQK